MGQQQQNFQQPPAQQNFQQPPEQQTWEQQQNFQQQQGFPAQQGFQQPQLPQARPPQAVPQQAPVQAQQPPQRSKVFFRISADGEDYGTINMELFDEVVPITARNFYSIASGQNW